MNTNLEKNVVHKITPILNFTVTNFGNCDSIILDIVISHFLHIGIFERWIISSLISLIWVNWVIYCFANCYFSLKVWNAHNDGAAVVLVFDDREYQLITMDSPEEDNSAAEYLQNITIPFALIEQPDISFPFTSLIV